MSKIEVIPFKDDANSKIAISDEVINLAEYLVDSGEEQLVSCNLWSVYVSSANVMAFDNGGTPSATLGFLLTSGQIVQFDSTPELMNFIRAAGSDAYITISGAKNNK